MKAKTLPPDQDVVLIHLANASATKAKCGRVPLVNEFVHIIDDISRVTCASCLRVSKSGRPRKVHKFFHPDVRKLLAKADMELASASAVIHSARDLSELVDAELEAERALHRIKDAMRKERELRGLNR